MFFWQDQKTMSKFKSVECDLIVLLFSTLIIAVAFLTCQNSIKNQLFWTQLGSYHYGAHILVNLNMVL